MPNLRVTFELFITHVMQIKKSATKADTQSVLMAYTSANYLSQIAAIPGNMREGRCPCWPGSPTSSGCLAHHGHPHCSYVHAVGVA